MSGLVAVLLVRLGIGLLVAAIEGAVVAAHLGSFWRLLPLLGGFILAWGITPLVGAHLPATNFDERSVR